MKFLHNRNIIYKIHEVGIQNTWIIYNENDIDICCGVGMHLKLNILDMECILYHQKEM